MLTFLNLLPLLFGLFMGIAITVTAIVMVYTRVHVIIGVLVGCLGLGTFYAMFWITNDNAEQYIGLVNLQLAATYRTQITYADSAQFTKQLNSQLQEYSHAPDHGLKQTVALLVTRDKLEPMIASRILLYNELAIPGPQAALQYDSANDNWFFVTRH